jgi:putative FmdB family regulatory protein
MPIYEFVCMQCESHYEELVPMGSDADCPDCGSSDVRKQFSVFAAHGIEKGNVERAALGGGGGGGGGGGCCGGSCGCGH